MAGAPARSWSVISFGAVSRAQVTRRSGIRTREPSTTAPASRSRSRASGTGISTPVCSRISRAADSRRAAVAGPSRSQRGVSRGSVMWPPPPRRGRGHTTPRCERGRRGHRRDRDLRPDSGPCRAGAPGLLPAPRPRRTTCTDRHSRRAVAGPSSRGAAGAFVPRDGWAAVAAEPRLRSRCHATDAPVATRVAGRPPQRGGRPVGLRDGDMSELGRFEQIGLTEDRR